MVITQELDLSLTENLVPVVIHVKQFDHLGRKLLCSLYQDSTQITLPDGLMVNVTGTRPDGNVFQYDSDTDPDVVSVSGNTVSILLTEYMTASFGRVPVDVILADSSGVTLGCFSFLLRVEKAALENQVLTKGSYSSVAAAIAGCIVNCYVNDNGYLVIETEDTLMLTLTIDDNGILNMEYGG
ncbi:MAG: hypothetical protein LUI10_04595 [Lachnospiraceae bacterium]|nr:hypothetical protein [Lachnospiraceae bacterium]